MTYFFSNCGISNFRREVDMNCALPDYYAACSVVSYGRFGTIYLSHFQGSRIQSPSSILDPWR